jgi:hypothetical protein
MIRLDKLIPDAVRRYDEDGEPLYTRPELVLKVLNRRGESTATDILDDLNASDRERFLYSASLASLVKQGRVAIRFDQKLRLYSVRDVSARSRCGCDLAGRCERHAEINRVRARESARRKAEAEGRTYRPQNKEPWMCHQCRERALDGASRCQAHTEANRERARRSWQRQKERRAA